MQLPWPFRRAQGSPSSDGDAASDPAASAGGGASTGRPAARADWRGLPPLNETIGPPPLLAPPRPFAGALAANNPPPPILAPLAHGRSIEAPSGLVVGIARPLPALGGGPIPMPAQRSPLGTSRRSAETAPETDSSAAAAFTEASHVLPVSGATPASAPSGGSSITRRLEATGTKPMVRETMTRAPEPSQRTPVVGLVGQPRAARATHAPLATLSEPAPQRAPITPLSALSPSSIAAPTPGGSLPVAGRLTIGQARRLGLGAPIAAVPIGGAPLAAAAPPGVTTGLTPGAATGRPVPMDPASGAQQAPAADAGLPLATTHPTFASPDDVRAPSTSSAPSATAPGPAAPPSLPTARVQPLARVTNSAAGRPSGRSTPILSARALRAGVQRAPLTLPVPQADRGGSGSAGTRPGPASSSQPVRVHRGAEASDLATALDARSFTHGGEIFMPSSVGSLSSGKGQALLAHEMTHVAQQRRLAASLPGEESPHGRTLEAEAVAAERAPDLTLAPRSHSQHHEDARPDAGSSVSVSPGAPGLSAPQAQPQRAPNGGSGAGTQRPGVGSNGHAHTEQELEVLAHQLYNRIGRHLRRELLVDRERAGLALDLP